MSVWANGSLTFRDAADFGYLSGDLSRRQDAAFARFGALGKLQLKHLDLIMSRRGPESVVTQLALGVPHAIFGRADLVNNVATPFKVGRRQPALAGVEPDPSLGRAVGKGPNRRPGQRAIAHS